MNKLPDHLGGHKNRTHLFPNIFDFIISKYNIKSMVDVGCGPGGMIEYAHEKGLDAIGIDGDWTINRNIEVIIHDFSNGPILVNKHDLAWSVEFLEHVNEEYMDNYFSVFKQCKYIMCTAALPGKKGHHHVNCQNHDYWVEKFAERNFYYDHKTTLKIQNITEQKSKNFIQQTGKFFTNEELK